GGPGRTPSVFPRRNGFALPTHGVCGAANGGVKRHTPGPAGSVGNVDVEAIGVWSPSPFLVRMIWSAATQPILMPASFDCPSGIVASESARSASRFGPAFGKKCTSVRYAASATAASTDAFL